MRISPEDMASRQRMARLMGKITDALASEDDVTYAEILIVLAQQAERWARYLRRIDLAEIDG